MLIAASTARADAPGVVGTILERERAACNLYLAQLEERLKGEQARLTGPQVAQLASEQARVHGWLQDQQARLTRMFENLKLQGSYTRLGDMNAFFEEMKKSAGGLFEREVEQPQGELDLDKLAKAGEFRLRLEKWLQAESAHLAELETQYPGIGKSAASDTDPPQVRELLRQYEKKLETSASGAEAAKSQAGETLEAWQNRIQGKIDHWDNLVAYKQELLSELKELRNDGITTPEKITELTERNSREIERAAIEYFAIKDSPDPELAARARVLNRTIHAKWQQILLAHDTEWGVALEAPMEKSPRFQWLMKACQSGKAFWYTAGVAVVAYVVGNHVVGGENLVQDLAHLAEAGSVGAAVAYFRLPSTPEQPKPTSQTRKVPPTQEAIRAKALDHLGLSGQTCLRTVYEELLQLDQSFIQGVGEAAQIAADETPGTLRQRVHVGTGVAPADPLARIADPEARAAAEHALSYHEALEDLDADLKKGRCPMD